MEQELNGLSESEKVQAENEFLKMKMMLENGARFGSVSEHENFTPEMENEFLKNVMAFEEMQANKEMISVFERIGKPGNFKPPAALNEDELLLAWNALNALLKEHGLELTCCSPNISKRELYRFAIEELFNEPVDKVEMEGWITSFIYDEFHPDAVYDNTRTALDECINIMSKEPILFMHNYRSELLRLNDAYPLTEQQFRELVNHFKEQHDELELMEITDRSCEIDHHQCTVKGSFNTRISKDLKTSELEGDWTITLEFNETVGYWYISSMILAGMEF